MILTDSQVLQALASSERTATTAAELAQRLDASEALILDTVHRLAERQFVITTTIEVGQTHVMITDAGRRRLAAALDRSVSAEPPTAPGVGDPAPSGFGNAYGNQHGGSPPGGIDDDEDEDEESEETTPPGGVGLPPLQGHGTGTVTWPAGRYREGTTIRELERDLLTDALEAGGGVFYASDRDAAEQAEFMPNVMAAAATLEASGHLTVDRGYMAGGTGPVRLTLTHAGRDLALQYRAENDRVRAESAERARAQTAATAVENSEDREPAIAIAWNPAVVTAEEYAELVEILGNLARLEGAKGIARIESRGLEIPAAETVTV